MYIDNQQDGENIAATEKPAQKAQKGETNKTSGSRGTKRARNKKRAAGENPNRSEDQNELRWFNKGKEKENPMSSKHSTDNFGGFGGVVNGLAVLVTISLVGAGYFTALGSFAGVA
ncbi:MAG: hypothetical protein AAF936_11555 [Pseudomonadota bacterium]